MFEPNTTVAVTDSAEDTSSLEKPGGGVITTARGGMGLGSDVGDGDVDVSVDGDLDAVTGGCDVDRDSVALVDDSVADVDGGRDTEVVSVWDEDSDED